jgi:hypothetical protein
MSSPDVFYNGEQVSGATVQTVSLRLWGPSTATIRVPAPTPSGTSVSIGGTGSAAFAGRVQSTTTFASGGSAGYEVVLEDGWADLERTTYQEPWLTDIGVTYLSKVILGLNSAGQLISTGQQVQEAVAFAALAGANISGGGGAAGVFAWPSEAENLTCADVIRESLRLTPNLVPVIDYGSNTLQILNSAAATASVPTGSIVEFTATKREDTDITGVRIVYSTANVVGEETFRNYVIDGAPSSDTGPAPTGTIVATVELAGANIQFQKQRVKTRTLPTNNATAKAWIKKQFPDMAAVPDAHFNVTSFERVLVNTGEEDPPPVNPKAPKLPVSTVDDLPRQLVAGSIEDWMRVKVGQVSLNFECIATSAATAATRKKIVNLPRNWSGTATNARTKTYSTIAEWTDPEEVPLGIAAQVLAAAQAAPRDEGSVSIVTDNPSPAGLLGRRITIGGASGVCNAVDVDYASGRVDISFGPAPYLGVTDFLEMQRAIRNRKPSTMRGSERTSRSIGNPDGPSSRPESIGGFDLPVSQATGGGGEGAEPGPFEPVLLNTGTAEAPAWKVKLTPGILRNAAAGATVTISDIDNEFSAATGNIIYLEATIAAGEVTGVTAKVGTAWSGHPTEVQFATTSPFQQTKAFLQLGKVIGSTSLEVEGPWKSGNARLLGAVSSGRSAFIFVPGQ